LQGTLSAIILAPIPMIPVIDLFAGPGGLGEGFSSFRDRKGRPAFRVVLSIEKDPIAHETLKLRSFFRQFDRDAIPEEYYEHLRGKLSSEQLYKSYPAEAARATEEAWQAELGNHRKFPADEVDRRIEASLGSTDNWLLIGGPPCQAYSIAGRSRMIPVDPEKYEKDKRHFLYKEYLRIIAAHRPPVFVMENVKGILSSKVGGRRIIDRILSDLRNPVPAARDGSGEEALMYKIYPLAGYGRTRELFGGEERDVGDYIVRTERHRIPQTRHRLILLGIRSDLQVGPGVLRVSKHPPKMWLAIQDLPRLRSRLSNRHDSAAEWVLAIREMVGGKMLQDPAIDDEVFMAIISKAARLSDRLNPGQAFIEWKKKPVFMPNWFYDSRLGGVCNHVSRSHMKSDLWRYLFAACYAAVHRKTPKLPEFPRALLPDHENVKDIEDGQYIFKDRFRVQVRSTPSSTVTSHIGKDGHYFIHPDPLQCRSLTVREAARLQTFPDNFLFAGSTTAQYQQVGNAVPPLLARQIAAIVFEVFN
jgi:DNA (cytosine-5)-methyltransferase 1